LLNFTTYHSDFVLPKSKKTQSNKKNVWFLLQDRPTHFF